MSDDTIYDRVSTLEDKIAIIEKHIDTDQHDVAIFRELGDKIAIIEKHIDTLMDIHKNQLAKREVRRVKDGSY